MLHHRSKGFALPVVILISAVILLSVVTATAVSGLGSRVVTGNEKAAYQALLAAESGLDSFGARLADLNYPVDKPLSDLANKTTDTWVKDSSFPKRLGLYTLSLANDINTTLTITATSAPNVITVKAESSIAGGKASKVVVQNYRRPEPAAVGAPAALTSFPSVDARGNSSISGSNYDTATGIDTDLVRTVGVTSVPTSGTLTLPVNQVFTGAKAIEVGQYVRVGTRRYRVTATNDKNLSLRATTTVTSTFNIDGNTPVDRIRYATTGSIAGGASSSVVPVNNPSAFMVGDLIKVGSNKGRITAIDLTNKTITVQWGTPAIVDGYVSSTSFVPSTSTASGEGTEIVRNVSGIASAGAVTTGGSTDVNGTKESLAINRVPSGDALFLQTFGRSKSDMKAAAKILNATELGTTTTMNGGLYYYEQSADMTTNGFCGSGILIVKANVKVTAKNDACPGGFTGVVYIIGNFDHQGNSLFTGAVVVEGSTYIDETNITGTGNNQTGQEKIRYDLEAVLNASMSIPRPITPVVGSWRQP